MQETDTYYTYYACNRVQYGVAGMTGGYAGKHTGRKVWSVTGHHGALASTPESVELCLNVTNKCDF